MCSYVQCGGDTLGDDGYGYDLNSQVTSFRSNGTLSGGVVTGGALTTLNFDASGNRKSVISGTTTNYTVNNLNEYATVTGVTAPTYDNNGNLLTYNGWTYTYDSMNRLTKATNGTTTAQFWYDGLNRQIARSATGSSNMISVMDGWNTYAEYLPASTTPSERLIYGAGGDLAKSLTNSRNYYADALGSTTHVATAVGGLLECYTYDLYGTPTYYNASGTVLPGGTAYNITRLFTGQQWHAPIGLYDNRNRFLKPDLGRFLQPDPIGFAGDPANLYRYCGNNPVNESDPSGLGNKLDGGGATIGDQPWPDGDGPQNIPVNGQGETPRGVIYGGGYAVSPRGSGPFGFDAGSPFGNPATSPFGPSGNPGGGGGRGGGGGGGHFSIRTGVRVPAVAVQAVGGSALQRARASIAVDTIFGTSRGSQLNALLQARGYGITLAITQSGITRSWPPSYIQFNPNWQPLVPLVNGQLVPVSAERALAHELGHVISGLGRGEPWETLNMMLNENPIMEELGEDPRSYLPPGN